MKQIIAIGGAGLAGAKRDEAFDRYILAQAARRRPRVCFIPTASGDSAVYIRRIERTVRRHGGMTSILPLFQTTTDKFESFLCKHDLIYVGGGNTRNMLTLWRLWGVDRALRAAYDRGIVLAGASAGAICWFGAGLTDSYPGRYAYLRAMGWLRGSCCPHFDTEARRQAVYRRLIARREMPGGYAVDDGVGLHFVDGALKRTVSARRRANALHIRASGRALIERSLEIDRLL